MKSARHAQKTIRKRKVSLNARCPCDSGKQYRDCCSKKHFSWLVDEKGTFYRSMKIHPEVKTALQRQRERFIETFGREPHGDDPVFFDLPSAKELQEKTVEAMMNAGADPAFIYAYVRTGGLLVTAHNVDLLPDKDLDEWQAAVEEFRKAEKTMVKIKPDPFTHAVEQLPLQLERAETYLHMIVTEHGLARNISARAGARNHSLHDYVFLCATKSLKTLRAVKRLIPEVFGEDALSLCRSIYENYLSINYVIRHPSDINSFVAGKVGLRAGTCEIKRQGGRQVIVEKDSGKVIGEKISVYRMAQQSSWPEDEAIYRFLYRYLSEFTHADIMALEAYLHGDRFDPSGAKKGPHILIYGLFATLLLLDVLSLLRPLRPRFRSDLRRFIVAAARKLKKVFSFMKGDDGSKSTPRLFIARLNHCLLRIEP